MTVQITKNVLIDGDPLSPADSDLIAQIGSLQVGWIVPAGWNVLSGNSKLSSVGRVAMRYEIEEEAKNASN